MVMLQRWKSLMEGEWFVTEAASLMEVDWLC